MILQDDKALGAIVIASDDDEANSQVCEVCSEVCIVRHIWAKCGVCVGI